MFDKNDKIEEESPWQILQETLVYDNPWISLTEYNVINPSGGKGIYGKVHFKNRAIGVLAIDDEKNVFLVGQFRFPLDRYSWELPEGGGPLNESPLEAAKRELLEETGLKAAFWEPLLEMDLSNSVTDEVAYIFLARELTQYEPEPEETERLKVSKLPFDKVFEMVMDGRITDSITVAAILKLKIVGY